MNSRLDREKLITQNLYLRNKTANLALKQRVSSSCKKRLSSPHATNQLVRSHERTKCAPTDYELRSDELKDCAQGNLRSCAPTNLKTCAPTNLQSALRLTYEVRSDESTKCAPTNVRSALP